MSTKQPEEGGGITREERFEAMYQQYEQRVLGYALRRAPVEQAKDAVAEAFLAAWRRFDQLPADPLPWLIGATRKTLANQRRGTERQTRLAERLAYEPPDEADGIAEERQQVRAALSSLPVGDREALMLVAWERLSPADAARTLGCSAVAFRVRLHRARRRLAKALEELESVEEAAAHLERPAASFKEAS